MDLSLSARIRGLGLGCGLAAVSNIDGTASLEVTVPSSVVSSADGTATITSLCGFASSADGTSTITLDSTTIVD